MKKTNERQIINHKFLLVLILTIGVIIRLFMFFNLPIIQKDSPLYLYQAMVLATGNLNLLDLCGLSSRIKEINLFSIVIVPFYYLCQDWEIAGKLVSFFSSSLSLILLYLILKRFFQGPTLYMTLLVFCFNPTLVKESAEIMRESFYTFLALIGILSFVKGYESSKIYKRCLFFSLANLFWLSSAWVRIEGFLFIFFSLFFLIIKLLISKDKKEWLFMVIYFFVIPIIISIIGFIYLISYKSFFLTEIKVKLTLLNPFEQPFAKELKNFRYLSIPSPSPYFWDMVKQNLWLIAFGTTFFYKFIPALHFPIFLIFLAGLKRMVSFVKEKPLFLYFVIISIGYLVCLWYFTFTKWYMEKRYLLPLLYSVSIIVGLGLLMTKEFLIKKFNISSKLVVIFLTIYIIVSSAVKIFQKERIEKLDLKILASKIVKDVPYGEIKSCSEKACKDLVFTNDPRILFYISNITSVPLCPSVEDRFFYNNLGKKSMDEIVRYIVSKNYKAVILEEEVFKEKTEIIKQRLNSLSIKVYILYK